MFFSITSKQPGQNYPCNPKTYKKKLFKIEMLLLVENILK